MKSVESSIIFCFCFSVVTAQLATPASTWPPLSTSATCNNSLSSALLTMFSPNAAFSNVVISSISYVNSTVICTSMADAEVALLRPTIKIYLFYGPKNTDYQVETLDNMQNLLTAGHWNFSRPATCFFPGCATSPGYSLEVVDGKYN
ncbi:hypothetical protein R5R35_001226 [Gryllus longicercus]|uniref:Accessory gland protein n=1 Tax=Gryllus longicercus TaxID=2509291 RepID=A0AAN9V0J9_9ORTH